MTPEQIDQLRQWYQANSDIEKICAHDPAVQIVLEQLRILRDTHGIAPDVSLATIQQQAAKAPVANSNFLKLAFLKGCRRAGLLDAIATERAAP